MKRPLTYGFKPINLDTQSFINICHGKVKTDSILIFYKIIINQLRKSNQSIDYTQYVSIHSDLIEKIFQKRKASEYIKFMVDNELIEMLTYHFNPTDPTNNKTRTFRIPLEFLNQDLFKSKNYIKVPIYDKKTFNQENQYKNEKLKKMIKNCDDILKKLTCSLKNVYLDLNSPASRELIKNNKFNIRNQSGYSYLQYMTQIDNREIEWYKRDDFGRVHFAWVSLNKKCHSLIRFKGYDSSYCKEVDIVNSQPYFSSILNQDLISKFIPDATNLISNIDFNTLDWNNYRNDCITGQFYESWIVALKNEFGYNWKDVLALKQKNEFETKMNKYIDKLSKWNDLLLKGKGKNKKMPKKPKLKCNFEKAGIRDVAKSLFFNVIFGTQKDDDMISNCFKKLFPDVWEGFKIIKSVKLKSNPSKKGSYTNLMYMMQKIESIIVIDTAVKNMLNGGLIEIIPRHDSILTPEILIEDVKGYLIKAFKNHNLPIPALK